MRVVALSSFPTQAAATRFRVEQFVEPLCARGIEIEIRPFLNSEQFERMYRSGSLIGKVASVAGSVVGRLRDLVRIREYDLLFVQREAMFFGPPFFEWLYRKLGRLPMVVDLDDATYVSYISPTYGRLGSFFKFFGKTDDLIRKSCLVVCGNRFIAEHVESKRVRSVVIPTVADTDLFTPSEITREIPVIGWIGTHSTFPSIKFLFPVLERLAQKHRFKLKLVGTGRKQLALNSIEVENLSWSLEREAEDFRSLDIGLYPIVTSASANEDWLKGKSGFKAVQYLAVGIPFVMSPVGVCSEIGVKGETHFNAESPEDWYNALDLLLSDPSLRKRMGKAARDHSLENYTVGKWSAVLADVLFSVVEGSYARPK